MKFKCRSVKALLRSMTAKQFRDWEIYDELEPFGEDRADLRAASVVMTLANIHRDPKKTKAYTLQDVVLKFGPQEKKRTQTAEEQFMILKALAAMHTVPQPKVPE